MELIEYVRANFEVPAGYDELYVRSIEVGKANQFGFEWPSIPGTTVTANEEDLVRDNTTGCPQGEGDGFCLATTYAGMSTGKFSARTLLVVAVRAADVLGEEFSSSKVRVSHAMVVSRVNGSKLVRRVCVKAYLRDADLQGADLQGANLQYANLQGANLRDADLRGADLQGANLQYVNLQYVTLKYADIRGAYLRGADLQGANLRGTNLRGAYLRGADLQGANLQYANLQGANLRGANLRGTKR